MATLWNRAGHYIFALWFLSSFFFFSLSILSSQRLDVYHTWCGLNANLECRSEICCTRLTGNTGCENDAKNRHLSTIPQLCRAISFPNIFTVCKHADGGSFSADITSVAQWSTASYGIISSWHPRPNWSDVTSCGTGGDKGRTRQAPQEWKMTLQISLVTTRAQQ